MFRSRRKQINTCCFNAGMSKKIGQFCNVMCHAVKRLCKQVAKVMRKHLGARYPSSPAAVSYTHLDVYKRQSLLCQGGKLNTQIIAIYNDLIRMAPGIGIRKRYSIICFGYRSCHTGIDIGAINARVIKMCIRDSDLIAIKSKRFTRPPKVLSFLAVFVL